MFFDVEHSAVATIEFKLALDALFVSPLRLAVEPFTRVRSRPVSFEVDAEVFIACCCCCL